VETFNDGGASLASLSVAQLEALQSLQIATAREE